MRFAVLAVIIAFTALSAQAQLLDKSIADFGFEYFRRESRQNRNVVVSPLSVHAAFSMLALGTRGDTLVETREVLGLEANFAKDYSDFLRRLTPEEGRLTLASRLWPAKRFKLHKKFRIDCLEAFGAAPEALDFSQAEIARETINDWVERHTEGLIPELIPRGGVNNATDLVLSNALYFESQWATPFREERTTPQAFYAPAGPVDVPLMKGLVKGLYLSKEDLEAVSLPYVSSGLAMAFIVPREKDGWLHVRLKIDARLLEELEATKAEQEEGKIALALPKFKVSQESKPLETLAGMGMVSLLGPKPNLEGLSSESGLQVSDCFHKAVVEVDEKGTKAAAATAITLTRSAEMPRVSLRIDRPFFFVLYQRDSLVPLFAGQVVDPLDK